MITAALNLAKREEKSFRAKQYIERLADRNCGNDNYHILSLRQSLVV